MKPKAVLAYCREKGIKAVDLRFVDLDGHWRHVTFPLLALTESAFEEGFGHEIQLDSRMKLTSHCVLLPHSEANYLDPFTSQPTLVLLATIQDAVMRDEDALDSRCVATRAMRHLEGSSIGDALMIRACYQFRLQPDGGGPAVDSTQNSFLACGPDDRDFIFRCEIADISSESGVQINRHVSGFASTSEIYLKPSSLVECCDDIMMLRYLVGQHARKQQASVNTDSLWLPCQWSILRQGESILAGTSLRGLSETGAHAMGGILRHSEAIAAIALACKSAPTDYPWERTGSNDSEKAICRVAVESNNLRSRSIEYRGIPANSNPYLVQSAVLMAMIDGIQNKMSPANSAAQDGTVGANVRAPGNEYYRDSLDSDRDFLIRGEVFSNELLDTLCQRFA